MCDCILVSLDSSLLAFQSLILLSCNPLSDLSCYNSSIKRFLSSWHWFSSLYFCSRYADSSSTLMRESLSSLEVKSLSAIVMLSCVTTLSRLLCKAAICSSVYSYLSLTLYLQKLQSSSAIQHLIAISLYLASMFQLLSFCTRQIQLRNSQSRSEDSLYCVPLKACNLWEASFAKSPTYWYPLQEFQMRRIELLNSLSCNSQFFLRYWQLPAYTETFSCSNRYSLAKFNFYSWIRLSYLTALSSPCLETYSWSLTTKLSFRAAYPISLSF